MTDWNASSDEEFRAEARRFFENEFPAEFKFLPRRMRWSECRDWYLKLSKKGWIAPNWPPEYGGMGLSPSKLLIYFEETERAGVGRMPDQGITMVGPTLIRFGNDAQRKRYLPQIIAGDATWCQGYSEPNAGSDLASLRTEAVLDGNDYVINGSKIWTTHAQWSNKIFCLVRTDNSGKPQAGITFLLFDLDLPGIEIKPLISISGDHEFNQVFFTDVRVPTTSLLGIENQGWTVAKYLLQHERGGKSATALKVKLEQLTTFISDTTASKSALSNDVEYHRELLRLEINLEMFSSFENRVFSAVASGQSVGTISSALKIRRAELKQQLAKCVMTAVDYYGLIYQPEVRAFDSNASPIGSALAATAAPQYLNDRAATIYAGSNEVQRNIIAKANLGL